MQCPLCGYQLSDFDDECPKCHGKGIPKPPAPPPQQTPQPAPYNSTIPQFAPPPKRGPNVWVILAIVGGVFILVLALPFLLVGGIMGVGSQVKTQIEADANAAAVANSLIVTPTTIAPIAPVAPAIVPNSTPAAVQPRPQAQESAPAMTGAPAFGKNQTFGQYSRETLALIDATNDPRKLSKIGLDLYAMSADSSREKERAQVRGDGAASQMWNYADSLFESLGNDAAEKVKFLDGRTFPEAYRAESKGRSYACAQYARAADSQLDFMRPKSAQEQENQQVLDALKRKTAPNF